ncbi:hypothetical protein, partial [Chelatococcus sp. YT9]
MRFFAAISLGFCVIATPSFAQDFCKTAFKYGLYDFSSYTGSSEDVASAYNSSCKKKSGTRSASGSAGFNLVGKLTGEGSFSEDKQFAESFCDEGKSYSEIKQFLDKYSMQISDKARDIVRLCTSGNGVHIWHEYTGKTDQFIIRIRSGLAGNQQMPKFEKFDADQLRDFSCSRDPSQYDYPSNVTRSFNCRRQNSDEFSIIINADVPLDGAETLIIPAIRREPFPMRDTLPQSPQCPNLSGHFESPQTKQSLQIQQNGCNIGSTFLAPNGSRFTATGSWNSGSNRFKTTVIMQTQSGCTATYNVDVEATPFGYQTIEYLPVNQCGFGPQAIQQLTYLRKSPGQ